MTQAIPRYRQFNNYSFGSPMPDRTFVPEACSTQTLVINNYTYQDNFPNPVPLWNPVGGAAIGWAGPGAMTVNCNIPNEGVQQALPCMPGVQNTLDLTLTFGNNDIQIMLLDPLTMLPLPGYPILYPAQPFGTVLNIQLFFIGPPAGNVIVQITSPGGPFPFPDMFMVNYAAISTQTNLQQQVCWDEDYRFGFNGMEKDNEAKGQGNSLDFGARIYDSRLGRWLSVDPAKAQAPSWSPFRFGFNNPIRISDPNGAFEIDKATAAAYPNFASYLKNLSTVYANKPAEFKAAFKQYSELTDAQVTKMLEFKIVENGTPVTPNQATPRIVVEELGKTSGGAIINGVTETVRTTSGTSVKDKTTGVIKIDKTIVDEYETQEEAAQGFNPYYNKNVKREAARLVLESTVFHEGTHYGDAISDNLTDQTTASQEGGAALEIKAYGQNLDAANAEAYVSRTRTDLVNSDKLATETKKHDDLIGKGTARPDKTRVAPTIIRP